MNRFGKIVLRLLLGSFLVLQGGLTGDVLADKFNLDQIEIEETASRATVAFDVPGDGSLDPTHLTNRHELIVTLGGLSVRTPQRIHDGGSLIESVDVEPWFVNGTRQTRMVVKYKEGTNATFAQEGDVFVVTVEPGAGSTPSSASGPTAAKVDTRLRPDATPAAPASTSTPVTAPPSAAPVTAPTSADPAVTSGETSNEPEPVAAARTDLRPGIPEDLSSETEDDSSTGIENDSAIEDESMSIDDDESMPPAPPARIVKPVSGHQDLSPGLPADSRMDEGPNITIDLQAADIRTVLRSIAESSGQNIVANSDVVGQVTLQLVDVPWRRALTIILKTQGLGYREELGVIRVAKVETLQAEEIERESAARKKDELIPLETQVMPVEFATASELLESVTGMLTKRGQIDVDKRTNALIVTDIPSVLTRVQSLVTQLDTRTPQVEIVAKLVDMDMSTLREIGIDWSLTNLHSTSEAISGNAGVNAPIGNPAGTVNVGIIRDFADFDAMLQALETDQRANIISNPKITTVNNREARILVGQEVPLIVLDEAGNAITELKKIGIGLKVTPYINQGDMITLDLHPQVSDLASQSSQQGGVIINTSEADTRVMVQNGETAVIGGLIRINKTEFTTGVPVLGKLPLVGGLFRSTSENDTKRELVIFVTPRIVE